MRNWMALSTLAVGLCGAAGCLDAGDDPAGELGAPGLAAVTPDGRSFEPATAAPPVTEGERAALVRGNHALSLALYARLAPAHDNLVYAPLALSGAMALVQAGARGQTARQLEAALSAVLPPGRALDVGRWLEEDLASRSGESTAAVQFETASRLWVQRGHPLRGDFQALVTRYREDALGLLDFARDAAAAREAIDAWVSERGRGAIGALLGPASLSSATRLAIASTAYLRAPWKIPFAPASTRPGAFTDDAGQRSSVSFMTQDAAVGHASRDGWTAVELLYAGDELSMVFLLPETQPLRTAQQQLDDELLSRLLGALERRPMRLLVPRFRVEWAAPLSPVLRGLGATDAFSERADFSGIDGSRVLQLAEVVHRTALTVDETGTEVTTASAALIRLTSARRPPLEVRLDRPFAFLVRDRSSGAFLFVGRVGRP